METTQVKDGIAKATKEVESEAKAEYMALKERVAHARDIVEDLRDRAELAMHERPYLLPVATGVVGLGVGILIGSKLSRILLLTAAGAMLSDKFRDQIAKVSRDLIHELGSKLEEHEGEREGEQIEDVKAEASAST